MKPNTDKRGRLSVLLLVAISIFRDKLYPFELQIFYNSPEQKLTDSNIPVKSVIRLFMVTLITTAALKIFVTSTFCLLFIINILANIGMEYRKDKKC